MWLAALENRKEVVQRVIAIAAIFCFIWLVAVYRYQHLEHVGYGKTDFAVFYVAGASITGQLDIEPAQLYERRPIRQMIRSIREQQGGTHFLYLPPAAFLFAPFSFFTLSTGTYLWGLFSATLFVLSYYFTIWLFIGAEKMLYARYSILLLLLAYAGPVEGLFQTGQVNSVVWLLLLAFMWLAMKNNQIAGGVVLAIAAALKIFPAAFGIFFLLKKQWRAVVATVGATVALVFLTIPFFGFDTLLSLWSYPVGPMIGGKIGFISGSFSLYGSFRYAVREGIWLLDGMTKKEFITTLDPWFTALNGVLAATVIGLLYCARANASKQFYLAAYSAVIALILVTGKNVAAQYVLWLLPVPLYFLSAPLNKKNAMYFVGGAALLVLGFFWRYVPGDVEFFLFGRPITVMMVAVLATSIWHLWKHGGFPELSTKADTK